MTIPQRYSLVTLGVADVIASTAFYRAIGWLPSSHSVEGEITFFTTPGGVLGLWKTGDLAAEAGVSTMHANAPAFRAMTLSINLESREAVDDACAEWLAAGGAVSAAPTETDWGGYSGYVADPDGNLWELAHNPFWPLDERGLPVLG